MRTSLARAVTVVLVTAASLAAGATAAEAAPVPTGRCADGWSPANVADPRTARSTTLYSRLIELRYSDYYRCAWGKISNGSPGDRIWVDRSLDGGKTWQKKSEVAIAEGRSAYTPMWKDGGVLMRACGKAGNRDEVECTGWY